MIQKVEGIVLSTTNYSESSKILNILTKEYGIIGVISKGSRGVKSKLRTVSENYTYGYFHIYYKKDKLSTLIECDLIDYFKNIKSDIVKLSYLSYICELTKNVYKQNEQKQIYDLLISAIKKIEEGFNPKIITNILELKYLDYLGVSVNLDGCVKCGSSDVITLSAYSGGYICSNCRTNEKIVDKKTLKMLRLYYYVDISKITELKISDEVVNELNTFLNEYYDTLTGLYINSKKFLNNLLNLK